MVTCLPVNDPQNHFNYCPSLPAAVLFSILFGLASAAHVFQARWYHKTFCWVLIMGGLWETVSFILRCVSIQNPTNAGINNGSFVLLVLAPLWINAFAYMVLARLVYVFMPDKTLARIKGQRLGMYFVLLDITSFVIQLVGAISSLGTNTSRKATGLHVYTAGVAIQQAVIVGFVSLVFVFQRRLKRESESPVAGRAMKLLYVLYASLLLITMRIIFRIVEFSAGVGSSLSKNISNHEAYMYCFDALPMFLALLTFHLWHPGKVLVGPESEFPKRKKAEKQVVQEEMK